ncbi:MAG: GNAT family N-acetyltransferase [Gemmatimonadota bacterium]|nr:MAG: GNAT family N-acetyltransferase [Gemmatimonadota bacterium]
MLPEATSVRFVQLGAPQQRAVAAKAQAAFLGNPFYARALGLGERQFAAYWEQFFEFALRDPNAAVYALEQDGDIVAVLAVGFHGFPSLGSALRFLTSLLLRIGLASFARYLRFALRYERVMRRPSSERRLEACGLWLFVQPGAGGKLGSRLLREATEVVRRQGKLLITGFIDAGNRALLAFYRRNGFCVLPPFKFAGMQAARIEKRLPPPVVEQVQ